MSVRNTASLLQMLASGLQGGMEGYQLGQQWNEQARQRQFEDEQRKQQVEDRKIQQAQGRLSTLAKLVEGQRSGHWDADFSSQAWQQMGYAPITTTVQVPRAEKEYVGQVEASRKDPAMLGPMPAVKGYKTVHDPKEVSLFDTIKPAPKLHEIAGSLVDSTGKVVYQAPPKQTEAKPRTPVRTVDTGSTVEVYFSDGTKEVRAKTAAPKAAPDPADLEERQAKKQERLEANLRKRAEALIPEVIPTRLMDQATFEQLVRQRNAAVETVYNGLLHQAQTKGQRPKQTFPAKPKKSSLVETLKAGGLL